jgi:DNA mismatch endonuclease (patch repair protein)
MDKISKDRRSSNMRHIRSIDTSPELLVRRFLHKRGLRYRLHARGLPGKPDIVFPSRRVCLFVHGCFWHGCPRCIDGTRRVKSNKSYWFGKIAGNQKRDARHASALKIDGWKVFTIWECQTKNPTNLEKLTARIRNLRVRTGA